MRGRKRRTVNERMVNVHLRVVCLEPWIKSPKPKPLGMHTHTHTEVHTHAHTHAAVTSSNPYKHPYLSQVTTTFLAHTRPELYPINSIMSPGTPPSFRTKLQKHSNKYSNETPYHSGYKLFSCFRLIPSSYPVS